MSTGQTWATNSTSSDATEKFGEQIGKRLRGGEVIELASDLGGGKTTLVRGLARGLGSTDRVASPTFTISKVYKAGPLELYHFDFYRLKEAGLMANELADVLGDPSIVVVVEWGGVIKEVLPADRLTINVARTGEDSRQITVTYPINRNYLLAGL